MPKRKELKTVNSILNGVERLFLQVIIGLPAVVLGLLAGWWGSVSIVPEDTIKFYALGGLLAGLVVDLLFLRRWVQKAYELPVVWFVIFYLFYSVCLLGFFMGVPVFNIFLGIVAGYYVGLCLRHKDEDRSRVDEIAHKTALFTAAVMAMICIASLIIAYLDASLVYNIQGMFKLEKEITKSAILAYSSIGGILLVLLEYVLTRAVVKFARFI